MSPATSIGGHPDDSGRYWGIKEWRKLLRHPTIPALLGLMAEVEFNMAVYHGFPLSMRVTDGGIEGGVGNDESAFVDCCRH